MESKKLSRTVRKRLNKKKRLDSVTSTEISLPEILPPTAAIPEKPSKHKKKVIKTETVKEATSTVKNESKLAKAVNPTTSTESKPETKSTTTTESKPNRKRNPKNKVVYINSNYGKNDASGVGGLIQAGLIELRKESEHIKTASDLTEAQAHIVKRQITRLHGGDGERVFKRPKHYDKTIAEATKELKQFMEKQKAKHAVGK